MPVSAAPFRLRTRVDLPVPVAASASVIPLVSGVARTGEVVVRTGSMVAVVVRSERSGVPSPRLICLTGPDAIRLPCAVMLSEPLPPADVGVSAVVGAGRVVLEGRSYVPARWWTPPRPVITDAARCAFRVMRYPVPDLGIVTEGAYRLADALRRTSHGRLDHAVRRLLGLGPGLTPAGDDVLAGALVTLRAGGAAVASALAAAVSSARPFTRTTAVSAGLLEYAAGGLGVPQVAALLSTAAARDADKGDADLGDARHALLRVGHSSGAALFLGVHVALGAFVGREPGK